MAATAETLQTETAVHYQFVDDIALVAKERAWERQAAWNLLEQRRDRPAGQADEQIPVDALSTAHRVLGATGERRPELYEGLVLDCRRLVAEWYRKKKPEYFPKSRHIFDSQSQEFFSHGLSVRQMTENALRPITDDPEEEARRVNERVEDATPQLLRTLGHVAMSGVAIRTISECTDKAIADYHEDRQHGRKHRGYGGYVPEIEKLMIRDIRLDTRSGDRFEEQVGLPGTYITHEIIQMALQRSGLQAGHMDKAELHGAQILVRDDLMDFVALLDSVASEQWCAEIFMGEEVAAGTVKDYANFRQEALERQDGLEELSDTVALFVLGLAEDDVGRQQALVLVEEFVKRQLLDIAKDDHTVAEQIFDTHTARGLREIAYLESIGEYERAFDRMQEVEKAAPGGGYCGAGSCGLEGVSELSSEGRKAKELGLTSGLLKDKERSCPNCGDKKVYYDKKASKACLGCGNAKINK